MDTKLVDEIYVEKDELLGSMKQDWNDFIEGKDISHSMYGSTIVECYREIKGKLKSKRWVEMQNDIYFDKNVNGCWLIKTAVDKDKLYKNFDSKTDLTTVKTHLKEVLDDERWDIPTKDELMKLTSLSSVPFLISNMRPNIETSYILYKQSNHVQGFDTDSGYIKEHEHGGVLEISCQSDKILSRTNNERRIRV